MSTSKSKSPSNPPPKHDEDDVVTSAKHDEDAEIKAKQEAAEAKHVKPVKKEEVKATKIESEAMPVHVAKAPAHGLYVPRARNCCDT